MGAEKHSVIVEFGEDTTIHGVREIVTTKYSKTLNIIWLLFFLTAVCVACYLVGYTIKEYMNNPTATDLSFDSADAFSPVVYCPEIWVKDKAANKIGYTRDMNTYIQTMMLESPTRFFWTATSDPKKTYGGADWDAVRTSLEQLLTSRNLTISSLLKAVSYKPGELAAIIETDSNTNYTAGQFENAMGMCYELRDNRKFNNYTVGRALLGFKLMAKTSDIAFTTTIPRSHANHFFIGLKAKLTLPENGYAIASGTSYEIKVSYMKIKKSSSSGDCSDTVTLPETNSCIEKCFKRKCLAAGLCEVYFPDSSAINLDPYCTYLKPDSHCVLKESSGSHSCVVECPFPCSYFALSVCITPFEAENLTNGESQIIVSLYSPSLILAISEYQSFSMTTLFCNVGGVVSLFVGCSIMSAVHAVCFFAMKGCNRLKH